MAFPITFASVVTSPGGTGSTITPVLPSHAAGDVIEIFVAKTGNVAWNAPSGWTIKQQLITSGSAAASTAGTLLYRLVLPGDSLPLPNPVCTLGATVTRSAVAVTKRDADINGVHTAAPWLAFGGATGNSNPIRPPAITTVTPDGAVYHYYCQRGATNAPEPTSYTQTREAIVSGTLVLNVSERNVADLSTTLSNQDASPASGVRWVGMIVATPSVVPPVVVTPATASLTLTTFAPTAEVTSASTILTDNFDDNSRDTLKWGLGSIAFENASVGVAEANQRVEISPLSSEPTPAIYGYRSTNTYDFTGRQARVRIAADIASDTEAWLVVVLDVDNYVRIWVAGGVLNTRSRVGAGNSNQSHGTYDFATQNHWRIRHDDDADEIVFEVGDGTGWSELRRIARPFTITAMRVYLSGGTGGSVASPALVTFDDFVLNELTQVTPSAGSLSLTTFAPTLAVVNRLTPTTRSLSLTTFAPTVVATEEEVVTPNAATLTTTTFAPVVRTVTRVIPTVVTLSLTGFAPQLAQTITPTPATITTTNFAVTLRTALTPGTGSLTVTTFAPTISISDNVRVTPNVASLSLTTTTTSLRTTVTPAFQSLTTTTFTPTITAANNAVVTPDPASLALDSFAPQLTTTNTPVTHSLTLTTFASVASVTQRVIPTTSNLTVSTFAPSVVTGTRVVPAPAILTLTTTGLTLQEIVTVSPETLTLTTFPPAIIADVDVTITPLPASLTTTGFAPAFELRVTPTTQTLMLTTTAPGFVLAFIPDAASLTLTANSPALAHVIQPPVTTLTLTGLVPLLPAEDDVTIAPITVSLTLTAFAPVAIAPTPTPPRRTFVVNFPQRTVTVERDLRVYLIGEDERVEETV